MDYTNHQNFEEPLENITGGDLDALLSMIDQNQQFFNSSNFPVQSLPGSDEMNSSNSAPGVCAPLPSTEYTELESVNTVTCLNTEVTTTQQTGVASQYLYENEIPECNFTNNDYSCCYAYDFKNKTNFQIKTEPETVYFSSSSCIDTFHPTYISSTTSRDPEDVFVDESEFMCRKGKRGAKHVLLWKFILDQLKLNDESIRWVNKHLGTFRFVDTTDISRKWGLKKRKQDMNFEKLSRGIRHYYKSGFMSREDSTRLVYRFHWRKVPKDWRPAEVQRKFESTR